MKQAEARLELQAQLDELDRKLRTVLPEEYQDCYEDVQPVSMGSAGLKFDSANRVAWDEIWDHFCDLAMAGGPPHKGKLLEPGMPGEIALQPERYGEVVQEICRAIRMVSDLAVEESSNPGWVRMTCPTEVMAGWLARAIAMENVSAHLDGASVELPAGPNYRVEKEIKNVVTAVAKTFHYFDGHIEYGQQRRIATLFASDGAPLLQPCRAIHFAADGEAARRAKASVTEELRLATGLVPGGTDYLNWLGLECPDVRSAIWMMRALVVNNTLARREERFLYVPVHPRLDPFGTRAVSAVRSVHRLAVARGFFGLLS